jgi:hypothetical protein
VSNKGINNRDMHMHQAAMTNRLWLGHKGFFLQANIEHCRQGEEVYTPVKEQVKGQQRPIPVGCRANAR